MIILPQKKLLEVKNLKTYFYTKEGIAKAVDGIDFEIYPRETLGIVGESGCGKSVTSLSIMGLIDHPKGRIVEGEINFNNQNLIRLKKSEMLKIRCNDISMIFQDPMSSLNPVYTVGQQISEPIMLHKHINKKEATKQSIAILKELGIPLSEKLINEYPYQLSGGMRQRVMIAIALSCDPQLVIADEPTTSLDVTIQAQILDLMISLKEKHNMSIIMVSHDLGVIAEISDRVVIMYAGKIMEYTDVKTLFRDPKHPYTLGLMHSIPWINKEVECLYCIHGAIPNIFNLPTGCKFHPRCPLADEKCRTEEPEIKEIDPGHKVRCWHYKQMGKLKENNAHAESIESLKINQLVSKKKLLEIKNLKKYFPIKSGLFRKTTGYVKAVDGISFDTKEGEILGIVGESGCGKTTTGRTILNLIPATSGEIWFNGKNIIDFDKKEMRRLRKIIQIIFQDPYSSLNPRMTVADIVGEPLYIHKIVKNKKERRQKVEEILNKLGLGLEDMDRYPHEFSGGQRQRIGIARTIAVGAKLIIADEPVSALDVSIQAQIINLLKDLRLDFGLTILFIAHDLSVIKHISDRVVIMYLGKIVELANKKELFANPLHPYTRALLSAIPIPDPTKKHSRIILKGDVPSSINPPSGCCFHTRCSEMMDICNKEEPELKDNGEGHYVACHLLRVRSESNNLNKKY